jgi:hypothetical protein
MWIMLLAKIHRRWMDTTISFGNNLLQRLHQILDCPLKLKIFNFQGSGTECNNFLVQKKSYLIRVQIGPCEGSTSIVTTNRTIEWIMMSVHIFGYLLSMLIPTSYCSTTCRVARPSHSIVWKCLPSPTKNTFLPSHYNVLFICFLILLVNIVVIFHKQKWFTHTIMIFLYF